MSRFKIRYLLLAALPLGWVQPVASQELYPNSEPASIVPKRATGVRLMNEVYNNSGNVRVWNGAMLMYGVSARLMLSGMFTGSNHHGKRVADDFISVGAEQGLHVQPKPVNTKYPYLFESAGLGFRYRFVNIDGDHRHFRMAVYGNGTYSDRPHDEAEVTAMGDNKGINGGLISTLLLNRLAVSLTAGMIKPFSYKESKNDLSFVYGNAANYSLSFGYLVYPRRYRNFDQTNINLYAELLGKSYGDLRVMRNGEWIRTGDHEGFIGGNYIELRPAVQFIVRSNLRIDVATVLPLVGKSYIRKYPVYQLNVQYYFFSRHKG